MHFTVECDILTKQVNKKSKINRFSKESLAKMSVKKLGIPRPELSGEKHPNWKGGKSNRKSYNKKYYQENKEKLKTQCRDWYHLNKDKTRNNWLLTKYGIGLDEYNRLLEKQNGLCAICQKSIGRLAVDHCHATNRIRGLLCRKCDVGLGFFGDDVTNLQNAIRYLQDNVSQ